MNPKDYNLRQFRQGPTKASTLPPVDTYEGDTAAEILAKLITVDGTGSGLDADLLDGQHGTAFVAKSGDTLTGPLVLSGNPASALQAAPKQYVDGVAVRYDAMQTLTAAQKSQARANIDMLKKNYIINGGMQISQENGTTAVSANGSYPVDHAWS